MSSLTTLARPYAKAAFDVARDGDALAAWDQALAVASAVVSDETMAEWLTSPDQTTIRSHGASDSNLPFRSEL